MWHPSWNPLSLTLVLWKLSSLVQLLLGKEGNTLDRSPVQNMEVYLSYVCKVLFTHSERLFNTTMGSVEATIGVIMCSFIIHLDDQKINSFISNIFQDLRISQGLHFSRRLPAPASISVVLPIVMEELNRWQERFVLACVSQCNHFVMNAGEASWRQQEVQCKYRWAARRQPLKGSVCKCDFFFFLLFNIHFCLPQHQHFYSDQVKHRLKLV